ncbi:arsenate reductase (glutaredoxin) [Corynebacterium crudilactis]|uniref:Arsenate reductase (Glutaredoxin) n=1 Tax=Corynebacterium crudilactis TaxID=1652495 RepID=A0A172QSP2_9CORY|nr:arsenate reductase (glutaredoxin) [Corynebacterium crudilactis]ANE03680.1 arsenate reductase (glutaredoxin) [Corynebacterium crudilactis]
MTVTLFHNPRCSTSRNTLTYLREKGIEPEVIQYLKDTPTAEELRELFTTLGIPVHDGIRTREAEYKELGLSAEMPEPELIDAILAHPKLLQRPIVVTAKGARIARPTIDVVDSIL